VWASESIGEAPVQGKAFQTAVWEGSQLERGSRNA